MRLKDSVNSNEVGSKMYLLFKTLERLDLCTLSILYMWNIDNSKEIWMVM